MNLLPKNSVDFGKEKYWDDFFSKLKSQPFEWYGEYDTLCEVLDKYIRTKEKLLIVGCGNSKLSADLYDVGFLNITNIDISATVVQQMHDKYGQKCPNMVFQRMDILEMEFENESFNVVLDKGTLDAIMVNTVDDTVQKIDKMFSEISRVLKFGGRYICISLLQEHILQKLLDWFSVEGWMIRINRCSQAEKNCDSLSINFPIFIVVCTKMKKIPGLTKILELALDTENKPQRLDSVDDVKENIKCLQNFAFLKHSLKKKKLTGDDICLDLCCAKSGKAKYRLYVVDSEQSAPLKYAILIVPQGRETEWLFSSNEGRRECASSANCERLVVVHLLRDFQYKDLEEVKKDLSANVMELAPSNLKSEVPFLSLGDDISCREVRVNGESKISGSYVVEDVKLSETEMYRRLIFLNKPYLIQSEVQLKKVRNKRKKTFDMKVDFDHLACEHHSTMISGFVFLGSKMTCPRILQIGLGGGSLAMFMYKHFVNAHIEVVELDPAIVEVAKKWFGVVTDKRLSIHVADGITYMKEIAEKGQEYDVLILDVDSKDHSLGISSPPPDFVSLPILSVMCQLVSDAGILLLNLACRDVNLQKEVSSRICSAFKTVFHKPIPNEVNDVLFCTNCTLPENVISNVIMLSGQLNEHIKQNSNSESSFDVKKIIENVQKLVIND